MTRREFLFEGRLMRVTFLTDGQRHLEEFIAPKDRAAYWRTIPHRGFRWRRLAQRVLHGLRKSVSLCSAVPAAEARFLEMAE